MFQSLTSLTGTYVAQARLSDAIEMADAIARLMATMPLPTCAFAGNLLLAIVRYHDVGEGVSN